MASEDVAVRKRQQIAKANKTMFMWVAGVAAIVGVAAVLSVFLVQKMIFNQEIIGYKQAADSALASNIKTFPMLEENIRALNSNEALLQSRASDDDTALQAILDALPSTANGSALGASLQDVLLKVDGVTVESLTVQSLESEDASGSEAVEVDASAVGAGNTIPFTFEVSVNGSDTAKLFELLQRMERSIRAINVQSATVEMGGDKMSMVIEATASYEPAKTIEPRKETKP